MGYPALVPRGFRGSYLRRRVFARRSSSRPSKFGSQQPFLVTLLLLVFGFELAFGIVLIVNVHDTSALANIGNILIVSLLIGIARAWELVGDWNTGIWSSIMLLVRPVADGGEDAGPGAGTNQWPNISIMRLTTSRNRITRREQLDRESSRRHRCRPGAGRRNRTPVGQHGRSGSSPADIRKDWLDTVPAKRPAPLAVRSLASRSMWRTRAASTACSTRPTSSFGPSTAWSTRPPC